MIILRLADVCRKFCCDIHRGGLYHKGKLKKKTENYSNNSFAVLQFCSFAVLQFCSFAVLQFCSFAVLQFCSFAVLQFCSFAV
ncbi:hypothetical protein Y71_07375 [Kosakonia radicincitans DSM 16656]|nr:hypothetical protein Y71_07375 [Kosakonia radicincitans DSM 16656]